MYLSNMKMFVTIVGLLVVLFAILINNNVDSYTIRKNIKYSNKMLLQSTAANENNDLTIVVNNEMKELMKVSSDSQLSSLLETMPLSEKYALLLQSFSNKILDNKADDKMKIINSMELLFVEIITKAVNVDASAVEAYMNAVASLCRTDTIIKTLRLFKASGSYRVFGIANGILTTPITNQKVISSLTTVKVPTDNREAETLLASITAGSLLILTILQGVGLFQEDVKPWANLFGTLLLGASSLDVVFRQGASLRTAAAGIERLILSDAERQAHSDGSAFLVGYLLGLPCFCFRPDEVEALALLRENPEGITAYKQPLASRVGLGGKASNFGGIFKNNKVLPSESIPNFTNFDDEMDRMFEKVNNMNNKKINEERILGLGRVLVWLMSPVAAEQLKYGNTIVSDPRRCKRLLKILSQCAVNDNNSQIQYDKDIVPEREEDQEALLEWAYYEATTLIRQYGDLLEEVEIYMSTGTSSVGECVSMIEDTLVR